MLFTDFYRSMSCCHHLKNIKIPMVFLNSLDDPIVPPPLLEIIRFIVNSQRSIWIGQLATNFLIQRWKRICVLSLKTDERVYCTMYCVDRMMLFMYRIHQCQIQKIFRDAALKNDSLIYVEQKFGGHLGFYEGGFMRSNPLTWQVCVCVWRNIFLYAFY